MYLKITPRASRFSKPMGNFSSSPLFDNGILPQRSDRVSRIRRIPRMKTPPEGRPLPPIPAPALYEPSSPPMPSQQPLSPVSRPAPIPIRRALTDSSVPTLESSSASPTSFSASTQASDLFIPPRNPARLLSEENPFEVGSEFKINQDTSISSSLSSSNYSIRQQHHQPPKAIRNFSYPQNHNYNRPFFLYPMQSPTTASSTRSNTPVGSDTSIHTATSSSSTQSSSVETDASFVAAARAISDWPLPPSPLARFSHDPQ